MWSRPTPYREYYREVSFSPSFMYCLFSSLASQMSKLGDGRSLRARSPWRRVKAFLAGPSIWSEVWLFLLEAGERWSASYLGTLSCAFSLFFSI